MARLSRAPVVPYTSERLADGSFIIRLQPALENFPCGDDLEDASRINRIIEEQVRRVPEQYLWVHKRFKTRPTKSEPRFYDQ
jgi:KDO2-lipid IV(A) lauroyltransferase